MENEVQYKSKTEIKKEAEERQKLGERLIKLSRGQLRHMRLPDDLREALIAAQSIKSNIAGRRQRQFIGALMRNVDPEPIRQALLQIDTELPSESGIVKETRMWIERLLTGGPEDLEAFIRTCPGLARQRLRQLLRNIKNEKKAGKPPKSRKTLEKLIVKNMDEK